jgi:hypothetical protein
VPCDEDDVWVNVAGARLKVGVVANTPFKRWHFSESDQLDMRFRAAEPAKPLRDVRPLATLPLWLKLPLATLCIWWVVTNLPRDRRG